jgi:nucleoid DNA-binding protein
MAAKKKASRKKGIPGKTGITKKQASSVFDELTALIESHLEKGAVGQFTFPGLLKIEVRHKPATKAHKGINPFTGEETMFKAKPARNVVKIWPLKKLKDMAV